jgi:hypothetical protein
MMRIEALKPTTVALQENKCTRLGTYKELVNKCTHLGTNKFLLGNPLYVPR